VSAVVVTKDHLLGFGAIIHYYATAESGIKMGLACVLGIELIDLMILSEPYTSLNLRNVSKSIAKVREPITPEAERFLQIVGDFGAFGTLRNLIAHSRWREGHRAGSIRPSRLDIREGKARVYGLGEEEEDWTVADLWAEADKLVDLNRRIQAFLVDVGAEDRILKNNRDTSSSTSA
jgi:hypothetical protein